MEEKEADPMPPVTPVFQTQVLEESMGRSNLNTTGKPGEIFCYQFFLVLKSIPTVTLYLWTVTKF